MPLARPLRHLIRDALAVLTVGCFLFPLLWWGLTSIKPAHAIFELDAVNWTDFTPSLANYRVTLLDEGPGLFASRRAILDSLIVAVGAAAVSLLAALPAAFAFSNFGFAGRRALFLWVLFQRVLPPIAILVPLVLIYSAAGLRDSRTGVILAHGAANLAFAVLLLKSFLDEVPREVGEAAALDGASPLQRFLRIDLPLTRGGIAATAVLCFIFSWTEFLMALFLTNVNVRLLPVQLSLVVTQTWGFTAALSMASLLPAFIFVLLVQRHLVRGLTMGLGRS
jgi:multiple sugar transport system permease protein